MISAKNNPQQQTAVVPDPRVCLAVTPTVLVVRPTFSVSRDHSPTDEQLDRTETAGQAATARLAYLDCTDVGFAVWLCS